MALKQPLLKVTAAHDDDDDTCAFVTPRNTDGRGKGLLAPVQPHALRLPDQSPSRSPVKEIQELMSRSGTKLLAHGEATVKSVRCYFGAESQDFTSPSGYETKFPPILIKPNIRLLSFVLLCCALLGAGLTVWEPWLQQHGVSSADLLKYASIPFVSVVFTYAHIWAALYMTFYPLNYRGWCQIPGTNMGLGWQGIVPNKAETMARKSVELMTMKLISVSEVFARIDPRMLAAELDPVLDSTLTQIIQDVAMQQEPEVWSQLPQPVKEELILRAREGAPPVIEAMCQDVKDRIEEVFDLEDMVVKIFVGDPGLLNHMFINCGYDELKFIRDCGGYMGLGFGIFQVGLWIWYSAGWMLPTFGLVVGLFSNWVALKMIFQPVEPIPICGGRWELQGLFLKRQKEVSVEYGKIVAANVLSSKNLIPAIISGKCADRLVELVQRHVQGACDEFAGVSKPVIWWYAGQEKYNQCRALVAERIMGTMESTLSHVESHMDDAMDLENLIREKLSQLPSKDFEDLLHPVFQEDEWKLVLMGGVLGVVVGSAQWWFLGG